jgi:hypothetical protein
MATYASIRYKFSGANVSGVLQASNNLSDIGAAATGRTNLGVAIGSDVQAFISAFMTERRLLTKQLQMFM